MPPHSRVARFDNAKFLLISLVVLGHFSGPLINDSAVLRRLYTWIHFFHMPAFIFLAGYFTKKRPLSELASSLLVPMAAFHLLYWGFSGKSWQDPLLWHTPFFHLWFLLSLFFWRTAAPVLIKIPGIFFAACLLSLAAGCFPMLDKPFSLARTFVFLPFFTAGLAAAGHRPPHFSWRWRLGAGLFLAGSLAVCLNVSFPYRWLFGTYPYQDLNATLFQGAALRLFILASGFAAGAAFLMLVPARPLFFTKAGSRSLYIYLWHPAFVMLAKSAGLYDHVDQGREYALLLPAALLASLLLGSGACVQASQWIVEPSKYLRRERKIS